MKTARLILCLFLAVLGLAWLQQHIAAAHAERSKIAVVQASQTTPAASANKPSPSIKLLPGRRTNRVRASRTAGPSGTLSAGQ